MTKELNFVDDVRSLHKPAWDSSIMSITARSAKVEGVEGKYVYLRTRRGVYQRAYITKESRDTINVRFVRKSNANKDKVVKASEVVKKSDVLVCGVYKN